MLLLLTVLSLTFFSTHETPLINDSPLFKWWVKPPIKPITKIYIYNVTNADEFLNGTKPVLDELGPYVYEEKWERKNVTFNSNGTFSYNLEKIFMFDAFLSNGLEDDVVVVPNIPLLSIISESNHPYFLKRMIALVVNKLKFAPFVTVTVRQLLWGYEDPLLKVMLGGETSHSNFRLMFNVNGTSDNRVTTFTGATDTAKHGLIDKINGKSPMPINCSSTTGSDGTIFPPDLSEDSTIHIQGSDFLLPLVYDKSISYDYKTGNMSVYRFTPPFNSSYELENSCSVGLSDGFLNHNRSGSPLLSFPHFYLSDDQYRTAFEGISPPDPEKHKFYIDIEPITGIGVGGKTRIQYNLLVELPRDVKTKSLASFPDIIFPVMWFEEGFDALSTVNGGEPERILQLTRGL